MSEKLGIIFNSIILHTYLGHHCKHNTPIGHVESTMCTTEIYIQDSSYPQLKQCNKSIQFYTCIKFLCVEICNFIHKLHISLYNQ